jgi:hypothetical protein
MIVALRFLASITRQWNGKNCRVRRVSTVTCTQGITTEKRNAPDAVVAFLFPGKTQETGSAWSRFYRVYQFCAFVCRRHGTFLIRFSNLNGGDDPRSLP